MPIDTICANCGEHFAMKAYRLKVAATYPPCCSLKCAARIRRSTSLRHGHARVNNHTKEFTAWQNMRRRCYVETNDFFHRYGARGITVCERWRNSFDNFLSDVGCAPSPKYTLGRIENEGNYEPGNVEWQTPKTQANNTTANRFITAFGKTQTLQQWSEELHLSHTLIAARIDRLGWDTERALSTPKLKQCRSAGNRHMVTFCGKTMNIADWARETGIRAPTIHRRLSHCGWPIEKALTVDPLTSRNRSKQD
jgi:hypothetical protein